MNINKFSVKSNESNQYPIESKNQSVMMRIVNSRAQKLKQAALKSPEFKN